MIARRFEGMTFEAITHEDDLDVDLGYLRALTVGRIGHYSIEKRYRRSDGTATWVQLTVSLVRKEAGAADFYVAVVEHLDARKQAERESKHDHLTGLLNRRGLTERLERELGRGCYHEQPLLVAFLDLDGFKGVNDSFGHAIGDQCLQLVARNLEATCRPGDALARPGGDEFVVLLPNLPPAEAQAVLARLQSAVCAAGTLGDWPIGASIGAVSLTGADVLSAEEVLRATDALMYRAKGAGGGRAIVGGQIVPPAAVNSIRR